MPEYIDRNALLETCWDVPFETEDAHFVQVVDVQDIMDAPAEDVIPVPKGSVYFTTIDEDGRYLVDMTFQISKKQFDAIASGYDLWTVLRRENGRR